MACLVARHVCVKLADLSEAVCPCRLALSKRMQARGCVQVEDIAADGYTSPRLGILGIRKHSEGQILNWEVGVLSYRNPRLLRHI